MRASRVSAAIVCVIAGLGLCLAHGCGDAMSAVDKAVAEIDRAISDIETGSASWQSTLSGLADKLPKDVQGTIRTEVQELASRSIAAAGVEAKCTGDFFSRRVVGHLRAIRAKLLNQPIEVLPPAFCQAVPDALDMHLTSERRPKITLTGYDFDALDKSGKPMAVTLISDKTNKRFPLEEARIGRTTHYQVTISTSGADFSKFIRDNDISKIAISWDGKSDGLPQILVVPWTPAKQQIRSKPLGEYRHMPPHTHGDRDFDTHDNEPTSVTLKAESRFNARLIEVRVYMKAREDQPDNTTVEGWSDWKVAYKAEAGWNIKSVSPIGTATTSFKVSNHNLQRPTLPQGEVAVRFEANVDRDGDDAGVFTDVRAFFAPVNIELEEASPPE